MLVGLGYITTDFVNIINNIVEVYDATEHL